MSENRVLNCKHQLDYWEEECSKCDGLRDCRVRQVTFFLPMRKVPTVTHQEKQVKVVNGKPVFYEPDELKAARQKLQAYLAVHAPVEPYKGAVRLMVKWCFPISGKHQNGEYKTSKPDTDNLQKLLKDIMTDLKFWKDDAQVAAEMVEKFWAERPGIYIAIEELRVNE